MHRTVRWALAAIAFVLAAGSVAWRLRSAPPAADTHAYTRRWLDLAYASASPAQRLDLYLPNEGDGPFPLIIAIHGGGFMAGDKRDGQLTPMLAALRRGYAVASINYRLSGEARFPAQIQDVKAAIRFLRRHASDYRLRDDRFAAWGGSAGGHLAALAGTSAGVSALDDPTAGPGAVSTRLQAVVDWYGPIDFLALDGQFRASGLGRPNHDAADSPESRLFGSSVQAVPARVRAANPRTYLSADDPPFLIQHGSADGDVPVAQSIEFAAALRTWPTATGAERVTLDLLPGAGHADPAFSAPANLEKVFRFLDPILRAP